VFLVFASLSLPSWAETPADPEQIVQRAWQRAQASGTYRFQTRIVQTTYPAPALANVGRSGRQESVQIEGQADLPARALWMSLQQENGTVEMRVEGDRAQGRVSGGEWVEVDNWAGAFAPGNDLMAYLAGAKHIQAIGTEVRAVPLAPGQITFTRYSFIFDGPAFAAYMRRQLEQHLREQGELPVGLSLGISDEYRALVGSGEAWIDDDGLPLRLAVHVEYPEQANGERVVAEIQTDFSGFDREAIAFASEPAGTAARLVGLLRDGQASWQQASVALALVAVSLLVLVYRRSKPVYAAFVTAIIFSMVVIPLLHTEQVYAFYQEQVSRRTEYEHRQTSQESARELREALTTSDWDANRDPLSASVGGEDGDGSALGSPYMPPLAFVTAQEEEDEPDPDSDDDGDGLTYAQEKRLGTDHELDDSDGDRITDDVEVAGFWYNGKMWYSDPVSADTNNDGVPDQAECPQRERPSDEELSPDAVCQDTDRDGTPDLFDRDDDDDGVPDRTDLSPFSHMGSASSPFTRDNPLLLQVDDLQVDEPAFVDIQLRPTNADHLWYALSVLDWPSGDERGQIQRQKGNDSTFADWAEAEGIDARPGDDNGDMRLVPMLEIEIPYEQDHFGNLPVQDGAPITRTREMTVGQWLDTDKLEPYGISVRDKNDDGDLVVYVPLNLVYDETGGGRAALIGRAFYWPSSGEWGQTQQVRVVWAVQMLVDLCTDEPCSDENNWERDQMQIVHSYDEAWTLTGLAVREDHGLEVAIALEDPAQEPSDDDRRYDDHLWALARGLEDVLVAGRDCDPKENDECKGNGIRDLTVVAERAGQTVGDSTLSSRFDNRSNGGTSDDDRWGIPITATQVITFSYDHEDFIAHVMMTETQDILSDTFTAYTDQGADAPTLLFAQEAYYRSGNLDEDMATQKGSLLTIDLDPDQVKETVTAFISWAPYRYRDGDWESYPIEEYWDKMEVRFKEIFGEDEDEPEGENILNGKLIVARAYYMAVYQGQAGIVQTGPHITWRFDADKTDGKLAKWITDDPITDEGGLITRHTRTLAEAIATVVDLDIPGEGNVFARLGKLGLGKVKSGFGKLRSIHKIIHQTNKFKMAAGTIAGVGVIALSIWLCRKEKGLNIVIQLTNVLGATWAVVELGKIALVAYTARIGRVTQALKDLNHLSLRGAVIGLVIATAVLWGIFIGIMIRQGDKLGSLAIHEATASVIASTIAGAILLAISAIPIVGQIIAAVIALFDSIVLIVCEAKDSEHGICKGISGWIAEGVKWVIYSGNIMVKVKKKDRIELRGFDQELVDPSAGMAVGNSLHVSATVRSNIQLIEWKDTNYDWKAGLYWWQYSDGNLKSSTVDYTLSRDKKDLHDGLDRDDMINEWNRDWDSDDPIVRYWEKHVEANVKFAEAGINRPTPLYLNEGFALPVQSCWVTPILWPPYVMVVCYVHTEKASNHLDIGKTLLYDVFPATLDGFYTLQGKEGGYALNWGQDGDVTFTRLKDADGDGLINQADGGSDPDDSKWDADGDGLSDDYEVQTGSDPLNQHSDTDGLNDYEEAVLGSNPNRDDSDGDGLNDKEERDGWEFVYDFDENENPISVWVTSDPTTIDGDGDEFTDYMEKAFGFHPRAVSDPNLLTFESEVYERAAPRLLLRFEETDGAVAFADDSGYQNPGECQGESCPVAGHSGMHGRALHFDGLDDYVRANSAVEGLDSGALSFGAWARPEGAAGDSTLLAFHTQAGGDRGALGYQPAAGRFYYYDGQVGYVQSTAAFAPGQWHHVVVVIEASGAGTLYVDGSPAATFVTSVRPDPAGQFSVGQEWDGATPSDFWAGRIDEVLVYNRALSQTEVLVLMDGRYNPNDMVVLPGDQLDYEAAVKNELFNRYAQGLLTTDFPDAFSDDDLDPQTFVLGPREETVLTGTVGVRATASAGVYNLALVADAQIDDWREASDYAELLLHLDEDASATAFEDSSGSQPTRDGECLAGSCPTVGVPGFYGTAVQFDGSQYVTADEVAEHLDEDEVTFGAWVYPTSASGQRPILIFLGADAKRLNLLGYDHADQKFYYTDDKIGLQKSANTFALGQWHLVMAVLDKDDRGALYVNGVQEASFTARNRPPNDEGDHFYVGGLAGGDRFVGRVDEVVVYNRALSPSEVQAHFGQPVLQIPFDEAKVATRFEDVSPFGNDGTCSGDACPAVGQSGYAGKAIRLNGETDYVAADSVCDDLTGDALSFGGYFNIAQYGWAGGFLFAFHTAGGQNRNMVKVENISPTTDFRLCYVDPDLGDVCSSRALDWKKWYHVMVVVEEDDDGTLYIDGVQDLVFTTSVRPDANGKFSVGQDWDGASTSEHFEGKIDEAVVFNHALTIEQVEAVIRSGIQALHLHLDDAPGTTHFEDTTGQNNASCSGDACPVAGVPGRVNQGALFDGVDDVVAVEEANTGDLQTMTLAAWVRLDDLPGQIMRFVTLGDEKAVLRYDGVSGPGQLHFYMRIDGSLRHIRADSVLQADRFQHVAGTYDGSTMRLYLDGTEVGSLAISGDVGGGDGVRLSHPTETMDGLLDEVIIYKRALDSAEVEDLYRSAPWFILHLDEGSGATTFYDSSGNNYHATPSAGTRLPQAGAKGQVSLAAEFDGLNDDLETNHGESLGHYVTIAAWVKLDSLPDKRIRFVSLGYNYGILAYDKGDLYFELDMHNDHSIRIDDAFEEGYWYHVAATWSNDDKTMRLYLNGQEGASKKVSGELWSSGGSHIGLSTVVASGDVPLDGRLDEVMLYHRALTPAEIYRLFRHQARLVEERQSVEVTVDAENPSSALESDATYRANRDAVLHVSASDPASAVSLVQLGTSVDHGASFSWSTAPECQDARSGTAWCPTFDPTSLLGEGHYVLRTRAVDIAGHMETPAQDYVVLVDDTPPIVSQFMPDNALLPTEPHDTLEEARIVRLTCTIDDPLLVSGDLGSGVATYGARFTLLDGDGDVAGKGTQVGWHGAGLWRVHYVFYEADLTGSYTVRVEAADQVGNSQTVDLQTIRLDTTPPVVRITSHEGFTGTITSTVMLSGVVTETGDVAAGVARVEIRFLPADDVAPDVHPYWADAALDASGSGVVTATWHYTVPAGMDGVYQIELRATDVLDNQSDESTWNAWRTPIDTRAPLGDLDVVVDGDGLSTVRTTYRCWAQDFDLYERADVSDPTPPSYDLQCPCYTLAPYSTVVERITYDQVSTWYSETFTDTTRLYELTASCVVSGVQPIGLLHACDIHGHCTDETGMESALPRRDIDSNVLSPAPYEVLDVVAPIWLTGGAYAIDYLRALTVTMDGAQVYTNTWPPATVTDTMWSTLWTPAVGDGPHTLLSLVEDWNGVVQTDTHPVTFTMDTALPLIDLAHTVLTTTHRLSQDRVLLTGSVTDTAALDMAQVQGTGGDWMPASLHGANPTQPTTGTWQAPWYLDEEPDGVPMDVPVRVTDAGGHTTTITQPVLVDLKPPSTVTITMTHAGDVVSPFLTLRQVSAPLQLDWTASTDGSGPVSYLVGWTAWTTETNETWQTYASGPAFYVPGEAQKLVAHVVSRDAYGNVQPQSYGPVYVDTPLTPDYITITDAVFPYWGWMGSGCSLIGVDRRIDRNAVPTASLDDVQRLYATWDEKALRLAWTGASWDVHGDLFIYLDTQAGGSGAVYNPFPATPNIEIDLPGVFGTGAQMEADYLVWVQDSATAYLMLWGGSDWITSTQLSADRYRFGVGPQGLQTDLYLPFGQIGIADPASAPLALVALASEESALRLWSTMPPANPVNSDLVVETAPFAGDEHAFSLMLSYYWPTNLGPGVCPNYTDLTTPLYADDDLEVRISVEPVGTTYSLRGDDLFWLWDDLFDPGRLADLSLDFDFLDVEHPPLGHGSVLTYTIHYLNRGTQVANGVKVDVSSLYALRLPGGTHLPAEFRDHQEIDLGNILPGQSGTATFLGQVDLDAARTEYYSPCLLLPGSPITCEQYIDWASISAFVYDDAHPTWQPLEWLWVDHQVDSDPPSFLGIEQPAYLIGPGLNTLSGYAYDASGAPTVTLAITTPLGGASQVVCPDDVPEDGQWLCAIDATALNGGTPPGDGDLFAVALRGTDAYGQTGNWVDWGSLVVDALPPTITFDVTTLDAYSGTLVSSAGYAFGGQVGDNWGVGGVEVCEGSVCSPAGVQVDVLSTYVYTDATPAALDAGTTCGGGEVARTFLVTETTIVGGVSLGLNITHTHRDDLVVELSSPSGTHVQVLFGAGGDGQHYDVWLDDAEADGLHEARTDDDPSAPYYDRRVRPFAPLSAFRGESAAGTWTLRLCDANPVSDDGTYNHSQLVLESQNTAAGIGTWFHSLAGAEALDDVEQTWTAYGIDVVGNRSTPPISLTFRVDNVAPLITVTTALTEAPFDPNGTPVPVLWGTASDGGRVSDVYAFIRDPDGNYRAEQVAFDGTVWTYSLGTGLPGAYTVWIIAEDAAGNTANSDPCQVTIPAPPGDIYLPLIFKNY
jgi:subtilisin-like proprotein convertase family protein